MAFEIAWYIICGAAVAGGSLATIHNIKGYLRIRRELKEWRELCARREKEAVTR